MKTACLDCSELMTASAIGHKNKVLDILAKYPSSLKEKLVAFIADNTAVMPATAKLLDLSFFGCIPHGINLVVQNSMNICKEFTDILAKIREVRNYFKSSTPVTKEFEQVQLANNLNQNKLLKDMPIRWGSTKDMCDRYIEQEKAVTITCYNLKLTKLLLPSQAEVEQLRKVLKILTYMAEVTTLMSSESNVRSSQVTILFVILLLIKRSFQLFIYSYIFRSSILWTSFSRKLKSTQHFLKMMITGLKTPFQFK